MGTICQRIGVGLLCLLVFFTSNAGQLTPVRLATTNWPPYVGKDLPGLGYLYVVVTTALQQQGFATSVEFLPWKEAKLLNKYQNEGVFPAYKEEQEADWACSDPMYGGPVGFYRRKNQLIRFTTSDPAANPEQALRGLSAYKIGVVESYTNIPALDKANFLDKIPAKDDYENLLNLQQGKNDLAFVDVFVAEYLIDEHPEELSNIEFMGPSLANKQIYLCFTKANPGYTHLLAGFNKGLKELIDSGEYDRIEEKYTNRTSECELLIEEID